MEMREKGTALGKRFNASDLALFLAVGKGHDLAVRRLLGTIDNAPSLEGGDLEEFLRANLDIDFKELAGDKEKLSAVATRFFHKPTTVTKIDLYFDRMTEAYKDNVRIISCDVEGRPNTCYLKYCDEGPGRESLAMRLNNLLTDEPVPFMVSGFTMFQLGIPGAHVDFAVEAPHDSAEMSRAFGKAQEYTKLLGLSDRKGENILFTPDKRVQHIDFGAAFHKAEDIKRFIPDLIVDEFTKGATEGREVIEKRYARHKDIVDALLARVTDEYYVAMEEENERQTYRMTKSPKDWVYDYLKAK